MGIRYFFPVERNFAFRHVGMSYITETGKTEVTATESNSTYFHH